MTLKDRIRADTREAMKAGDKDRLKALRMLLAAIQQVEVDRRAELDDAGISGVLRKMVKQRRDSARQFGEGGRADLAAAEEQEIAVLEAYLPAPLADSELDALIDAAIAETGAASMRDMGKVMGVVKAGAEGRADMGRVGARVKARLGG